MSNELGKVLLQQARAAIARHWSEGSELAVDHPDLAKNGACFVTLTQRGQLRGCIGSLEAWRPLGEDVRENARAAAFRDPRFPPLGADEWPQTTVEVSLLSPPEALDCPTEASALATLRPGIDGVILQAGARRATFLPQVWEQLPDPRDFLAHLKRKAGLPADGWPAKLQVFRYSVQHWRDTP